MGCDIHIYAEIWKDNAWHKAGSIFPDRYFNPDRPGNTWLCYDDDGNEPFTPHAGDRHTSLCYLSNQDTTDEPYSGRNYSLFGLLAGVRTSRLVPIVPPRGVPDDASVEYRAISDRYGVDGHSHSWLTVAELQAVAWNEPYFEAEDIQAAYEGWTLALKQHKDGDPYPERPKPVVRTFTRAEIAGSFFTETLPRLAELGRPEQVRVVFFFDN